MKTAVVQSNYIPWLGYFDLIKSVDTFVLYDNVQYTNRDWRNRNRIKTAQGIKWLSIPVESGEIGRRNIKDIRVFDSSWSHNHLETIRRNYSKAEFFDECFPTLRDLYNSISKSLYLSEINEFLLREICRLLEIRTEIVVARFDFDNTLTANEKLIEICKLFKSNMYVSGPAARAYLNEDEFSGQGIGVQYFQYRNRVYKQLWGDFQPGLSVVDELFNSGFLTLRGWLNERN